MSLNIKKILYYLFNTIEDIFQGIKLMYRPLLEMPIAQIVW